jgi:hypothetical protein
MQANRGRVDGSIGEAPDVQAVSIDARSSPGVGYADAIASALVDHGMEHDGLENVEIQSLNHQKRDNDEPDLMHRVIVRGIKNEGFSHDIAFNHYSNGGTLLHLGGFNESLNADPSLSSGKRAGFGHVGFKIAFTTRKPAALTQSQIQDMSTAIAQDWQQKVVPDASDYIGLVKDGHKADFYYRIIPEIKGFGLNYESVDVCGGMESLL